MTRHSGGGRLRIGIDARDAYASAPRGVGKALADAIQQLVAVDRGVRLHLYRDADSGPDRFGSRPWVREVALRMRGHRFSLWERIALPLRTARDRLDVFHAPFPIPIFRLASPWVVTIHDLIPIVIGDGWSERAIEKYRRLCVRNAAATRLILSVSETTKSDLVRILGVPAAKIRVVYWAPRAAYGCATSDDRARVRRAYDLPEAYFLTMGGAAPRKNLRRVIEAFAALPSAIRRACPLLVGGVPSATRPALAAHARDLGAGTTVRLHDYLPEEDLPALLAEARALLYLSLYEGFGLPLLEAMASGAPVLASNRSAIPEIAAEAAAYVDPEDTPGIEAALHRLFEDETYRNDLRARGLARAREFSWEATAQGFLAAYREAAE